MCDDDLVLPVGKIREIIEQFQNNVKHNKEMAIIAEDKKVGRDTDAAVDRATARTFEYAICTLQTALRFAIKRIDDGTFPLCPVDTRCRDIEKVGFYQSIIGYAKKCEGKKDKVAFISNRALDKIIEHSDRIVDISLSKEGIKNVITRQCGIPVGRCYKNG